MLRICLEPGCPTLFEKDGNPRCKAHRTKKRTDRETPNQQAYAGIGSLGRQWRRVRAEQLRRFPICQWHEGCISPAEHVHHLDGKGPAGQRGLDPTNLASLCVPHHAQEEAAIRPRGEDGRWMAA